MLELGHDFGYYPEPKKTFLVTDAESKEKRWSCLVNWALKWCQINAFWEVLWNNVKSQRNTYSSRHRIGNIM